MTEPTALIVGASRGLGLGLARELLARKWTVIGTARDVNGAALKKLSEAHPGRLHVEALDVNDEAQQRALKPKLGSTTLDLLFVNAGITDRAELSEVSQAAFTNVMLTNVLSPVQIASALRENIRPGGTVAFMSSRMGSIAEMNVGNSAVYRASKAALNALTRCFVAEVGAGKFTVLSFHPGWVRTDMGGPNAAVSIEDSVRGIVDVLEHERGSGQHKFLDYQGNAIPW
jgi:NAD(P)-dependent dehydrogenase (short-subunit alcohol dehydrogenase family)